MGIVIRQSAITTIVSYVGIAVGYINLLYLYPKFLRPEQIGLMRTVMDAAILFAPFAQVGLTQSIIRYFPRLVHSKQLASAFISLILLLAFGGFALFLMAFKIFEHPLLTYFDANAREFISYSTLVLWLTFMLVLLAVIEAYARSLLRTVISNLIREVLARVLLAALVTSYFLGLLDFNQFMIGVTVVYGICLLVLSSYLVYHHELQLGFNIRQLDYSQIPGLIKYSLLGLAGTAGLVLIGKVDSLMVSGLLGLGSNAVYTTAFYMATVIEVPKRALSQITMPLISRAFESHKMDEIQKLYAKTSLNQFIIGAFVLIGIWANLHSLFILMPNGNLYQAGYWVVVLVGLGKLIDMIFGPSSEIIVMSKFYAFNIILVILLAILIVVTNNLLIPKIGIIGAAIGSAISLFLFNAAKFGFIYWRYRMQPFTMGTAKVLVISLVCATIVWFIPRFSSALLDIVVRSMIITCVYGLLIWYSNVSEDGSALLARILNKFASKWR